MANRKASSRSLLTWTTIWIWASGVAALTVGAAGLLFWHFPASSARDALDIIRTAGTLGVGTGGGAALLLNARKQRSTEHANEDTRHDAEERRISELQAKAGEQLGSDKAVVRLNALYQLERLGQSHEEHRKAIIQIICAYLRMPFTPPRKHPTEAAANVNSLISKREPSWKRRTELRRQACKTDHLEESEVRQSAQKILLKHLQPYEDGDPRSENQNFWGDVEVDLSGAVLNDFGLVNCRIKRAKFDGARFIGRVAGFMDSDLGRHSSFNGATFECDAYFWNINFSGDVSFDGISLPYRTSINNATFRGRCSFSNLRVQHDFDLYGVTFDQGAVFSNVAITKRGSLELNSVTFNGHTRFDKCIFYELPIFNECTIAPTETPIFHGTKFFSSAEKATVGDFEAFNGDTFEVKLVESSSMGSWLEIGSSLAEIEELRRYFFPDAPKDEIEDFTQETAPDETSDH